MDLIDFRKYKQKSDQMKKQGTNREFDDYYEYCLIDQYEEKFDKYRAHGVQIGDVFANLAETKNKLSLFRYSFPKAVLTLRKLLSG